jgi:glucuronokinase
MTTCFARAALAGNPSDGYGGAVVAVPLRELSAVASVEESDTFSVRAPDRALNRLLSATADEFEARVVPIDGGTLSAITTVPRSVGLAGSSALVVSALRALAAANAHRWDPIDLAETALAVERDRLGIEAGLQDRLVQAVGSTVAMEFDPVGFRALRSPIDLPLFVAWSTSGAEPSNTLHRSLRRRFDAGDEHVRSSMIGLTEQARAAAEAIERGDLRGLATAINRTFELRALMVEVDPTTRALADIGRRAGAAMNSAGSGGSVVGLVPTVDHLARVGEAYESAGFNFLEVG